VCLVIYILILCVCGHQIAPFDPTKKKKKKKTTIQEFNDESAEPLADKMENLAGAAISL